jgi:biotin carboxyl carrier protein
MSSPVADVGRMAGRREGHASRSRTIGPRRCIGAFDKTIVNNRKVAYDHATEDAQETTMPPSRLPSDVAGIVWKIEVRVGDTVAADQTLLIIESMKMEIPVSTPHGGTVLELLVAEGEGVAEGQDVVVIG